MSHFTETRGWIARQMCPNEPPPLPGPLKISVLTQCSRTKKLPKHPPVRVVRDADFLAAFTSEQGKEKLAELVHTLAPHTWPAEDVYTGQQHRRLMRAVQLAREVSGIKVDVHVASAGWGLIPGTQPVVPYDMTLSDLRRSQRARWAEWLGLPAAFTAWLAQPHELKMMLLGDTYLDAVGLSDKTGFPRPTIMFCSPSRSVRVSGVPNLYPVSLGNPEAGAYHCGVMALKGEVAGRFVAELASNLDFRARALFALHQAEQRR